MRNLIQALSFQAGWWACIGGVGHGLEWEAIVFCLALMGAQLYFSPSRSQDMQLGGIALLTGIFVDTTLQRLSYIDFYGWALAPLSPFWLWLLWAMFGLTLNSLLSLFRHPSPLFLSIAGLVSGPLTYYAGAKLGAAHFIATPVHLAGVAVAWMLCLPFLSMCAQQVSGAPKHTT